MLQLLSVCMTDRLRGKTVAVEEGFFYRVKILTVSTNGVSGIFFENQIHSTMNSINMISVCVEVLETSDTSLKVASYGKIRGIGVI